MCNEYSLSLDADVSENTHIKKALPEQRNRIMSAFKKKRYMYIYYIIPVVPHEAVPEVSKR